MSHPPFAEHSFRGCCLRAFPTTQYVETVWPDGARAGATRDSSEMGNAAYAAHLGYPDCWTALVSHELAHTLIAERMGHPHSPTLRAVALGYAAGTAPYEERLAEEAVVLSFERFANTGELAPILDLWRVRPHLNRWREEFTTLRRVLFSRIQRIAA